MTRYLIPFDDGGMTFPEEELPDVADAAHEVVQEAKDVGVWVFGGRLKGHEASVVATDGTVTDGPYPESKEHLGGFAVVDVPAREEALNWAAKIAVACRCAQEVRGSCPTRPSDRRRPATLEQDLPWPRGPTTPVRAHQPELGTGHLSLRSGVGQSPALVLDRIPATTDRAVERQPGPSRRVCPLIGQMSTSFTSAGATGLVSHPRKVALLRLPRRRPASAARPVPTVCSGDAELVAFRVCHGDQVFGL